MESNDDRNLEAINASVGGLVWVRRRNGSWWPGKTLVHEEVPDNSSISPKVGTPIKLLGREDVSVDWYILEKSKMVKAFRCGEYDACIEKAKVAAAAASSSNKKTAKCTLREDAIINALEIENAHLAKEDPPDDNPCSSSDEEDSQRCSKDDEDSDSDSADDELDSAPEQLQSSMSSQEMNNVGASKGEQKRRRRRRRTPNDSEDDGTEGIKRMRGLEDIGKEHVVDVNLSDSMLNGALALKRKRSQVMNANECSKRKNRRRQLTKVLESTAMVSVPVTCDQLVTSDCDRRLSGMDSVESMKSVSVVINNNSDSTGISCENASENVVGRGSHNNNNNNKAKDSEISSVSVSAEDDSSDQLFDVPLLGGGGEKYSAGFPGACTISSPRRAALVSGLTRRRGRSSDNVFVKKEGSNGSPCTSPPRPTTQPVNCNLNGIEKNTSKWQQKGKRNSRQMSKKQEARRNVYGEEANNTSLPQGKSPVLYEVKIEVKANYNKPRNVPLVSRMSELNGKAIVGHPLTVEVLEEGYCNGVVKSLSKMNGKKRKSHKSLNLKKKKLSSLSIKTRRLSTLTSQRLTERSKKQTTTEKAKETVVACIPLKVVFSRINQVLKGSARQTQHRALPSAAKT